MSSFSPIFSSLHPSQTASLISSYVPPFATGTTFVASNVVASTGLNASPTSSLYPADPTVPAFANDVDWVTAYLTIHSLSSTSYVYAYIFWMAAFGVFAGFALLHATGARGGALGAWWSRWAIRRRTWRKKHALRQAAQEARRQGQDPVAAAHRQPRALPSNAQLLALILLVIATIVVCVAGPDYLNPDSSMFDFSSSTSSSSSSSSTSAKVRRTVDTSVLSFFTAHYTIAKAVWTSAARTGDIAFALLPLCVLFALKAPPFALLAIPRLVQLHFDKLGRLHRWAGRLVWACSAAHVVLWCVQLARDTRAGTSKVTAWHYVWKYEKFRFGWAVSLLLTFFLLSYSSAHPHISKNYYRIR